MAYTPTDETRSLLNRPSDSLYAPDAYKRLHAPRVRLRWFLDFVSLGLFVAGAYWWFTTGAWWALIGGALAAMFVFGIRECFVQSRRAIVRIYGPMGRLRYLFETEFRDKFLQYFNERNMDGRPIPRIVRDYIYQKAKTIKPLTSFGTELDNYDPENTTGARILHYNFGGEPEGEETPAHFEVVIGEHREGVRPFVVHNTLNVSGMSFGSINQRSCEALSLGAKGVAYVNTGEGGYGPHGIAGNDVVFQLGTGKFGARRVEQHAGHQRILLDEQALVDLVREHPNIGMLQIKLSQGAKPGLGGHLPGAKVTPDIAAIRRIPVGEMAISPRQHAELEAPTQREAIAKLMEFCRHLRQLTELPVGIKLCVGRIQEIDLLVEAMKETGEGPDAIQFDGADGGTGASPNLWVNYVGYGSAIETLAYAHRKLQNAGIRDRVALHAAGRILTPAHAVVAFAFGADYIDSARAMMLSLGCIQSLRCHTNACPTGIATNDPWRQHGLSVMDKYQRVHNYLTGFHHDMMELTHMLHHIDPRDIEPADLRLISHQQHLASHFDADPWGLILPRWEGEGGGSNTVDGKAPDPLVQLG